MKATPVQAALKENEGYAQQKLSDQREKIKRK